MPADEAAIEKAWREWCPDRAAAMEKHGGGFSRSAIYSADETKDAFTAGYRAAQAVAEQRVTLRAAQARIQALEELIASAAPLTWAAAGDQDDAVAWEKRAEALLNAGALPSLQEKT